MDPKEQVVQAARVELAKRDFAYYCEYVHEGRWIPTRFHRFLCGKVQEFLETQTGHPYDVLIVNTPPQFGKSQTITETLPSWILSRNPTKRIILASYGEDFAEKFGRSNRNKIERFGNLFGMRLAKTPSGATEFELTNHIGSVISRGMMSGITGRSGDVIIIDDPVKNRQEADSETYRSRMWDEWLNSLKTRLQANGKVIVILTRWHEGDLAGQLIANDPYVSVIRIPCEAEEDDVLGREVGEGLCPEIGKGTEWLQAFKQSYINDSNEGGLRAWNALYQGRPTASEGNLVRRSWFRYYSESDRPNVLVKENGENISIACVKPPEKYDKVWMSWDCAFKDGDTSDFVCGVVLGRRAEDYFLLDMVHGRMDIMNTLAAIELLSDKWPNAVAKLIEEKANGAAVIQMLRHELGGIIAVNPKESKESRVNAITPMIRGGNVYLPHPLDGKWVQGMLEEFASFPNGSHDDMVDAVTQGIQFYMFDRTNKDKTEIPEGTHVYQVLKAKGWKDFHIRQALRKGRIKLLGEPKGFR